MSYASNIQWTDSTWNPWYGCIKVAEGCKNCYMYRDFDRWKKDPRDIQRSKTRFNDPLKWGASPRMIFTCSLSDFFIEQADPWRREAWNIISYTPDHFYQILTKRPERIEANLPEDEFGLPRAPKNTIFIYSASTQKEFDAGWPIMESLKRHWGIRIGVSLEPLLEAIDITDWLDEVDYGDEDCGSQWSAVPDWVIVGGESGHKTGKYKRRACELHWLLSIVNQCHSYEVPVFLKQLGSHLAEHFKLRHPHGGDSSEWILPMQHESLRQFPEFMKLKLAL